MATTNVACPFCGEETRITVPEDETIDKLMATSDGNIRGGCSACGNRFSAYTS